MTTVAVLGTGIMGAGMARSLLRAGFRVRVWNRSAERAAPLAGDGAIVSSLPAEAVEGADVIVLMLFDQDAVLQVLADAATAIPDRAVILQCSTIGPLGMHAVATFAGAHGLQLLDSPVLGTKQPAEQGQLVVLASGDPALRTAVQPVLDAVGSRTVWAGDELGLASSLKLACNAWVGTLTAGAAQSLALAKRAGLNPQLVFDAISGGALDAPYLQVKGKAMIAQSYPVAFVLDGVRKDVDLIISMADQVGVSTDLLLALRSLLDSASASGHGGEDMAAIYEAF